MGLKWGSGERRAGEDTRPYTEYRDGPILHVGAGHWPARGPGGHMGPPLQPKANRYRWLGNARRGGGIATTTILEQPAPSGAEEIAESHSDFARRKCFAHPKG